jgi:hypothetical protein
MAKPFSSPLSISRPARPNPPPRPLSLPGPRPSRPPHLPLPLSRRQVGPPCQLLPLPNCFSAPFAWMATGRKTPAPTFSFPRSSPFWVARAPEPPSFPPLTLSPPLPLSLNSQWARWNRLDRRTPSRRIEPSPPLFFALVSSPPLPLCPRLLFSRNGALYRASRVLWCAPWPPAMERAALVLRRPPRARERIRLVLLFLPVLAIWKMMHRSARMPNSGDLARSGNGAPPPPPCSGRRCRPIPPISNLSRQSEDQQPGTTHTPLRVLFLKSPCEISISRPRSSARNEF